MDIIFFAVLAIAMYSEVYFTFTHCTYENIIPFSKNTPHFPYHSSLKFSFVLQRCV